MQSIEDVEAPGESQECEALGVEKLRVTGEGRHVKSMEMEVPNYLELEKKLGAP